MLISSHGPLFYARYIRSLVNPEWAVDLRHVLVISEILSSRMLRTGLEIGAYYGTSTCAFVEAAERRSEFHFITCDTEITEVVRNLVNRSSAVDQIELMECDSIVALEQLIIREVSVDIAFLDGAHVYYRNAVEAALLQCLGVRTLLLHDTYTQSSDQYGRDYLFDGPKKLLERFRSSPSWFVVEDNDIRPQEQTHRGLSLVSRDQEVWETAMAIFSDLRPLSVADLRKIAGAPE